MTGRPILQTQFERRMWRTLNGGGILGRYAATNGGSQTALESISTYQGTVDPGLLVSLMDRLAEEGKATAEVLRELVSSSRAVDCTPSIRASEILLEKGEFRAAEELLARSDRSQEVLHRSIAEARIRRASGDMEGAKAAAVRAYESDPSCDEPYAILAELDPYGEWPQRHNIQQVFDGRSPSDSPGEGRMQELYRIYYEWFRGSRESASEMLAKSRHYASGDRDFMLASARMSVDEGDWHSADMMYARLLPGAPAFLRREMAEASLDAGDYGRALQLLAESDQTSPRTMLDTVRARYGTGDRRETMVALRAYLDSEWAGSEEYLEAVRMLIGFGMDAEASTVLDTYVDSCGNDAESLILRSMLSERAGDSMSALIFATEATMREKGSRGARAQRARVYLSMDDPVKAGKECARILAEDPNDPDALRLMMTIQSRAGDHKGALESCRKLMDVQPADAGLLLDMVDALMRTGSAEDAADAAHRAVRMDGTMDVYTRAISVLMSSGPNRDASYLCREAETRFPREPVFKRIRGNMEYAEGEYVRASASYAEAALGDPENPGVWYSKGMSDEASGDLESAEEAFDRALALDPDDSGCWIAKASVREARGDLRGAVRALDRAAELDRADTYPMVRKAVILSNQGRHAEALRILGYAARMEPDNASIRDEMERVRREMDSYVPEAPETADRNEPEPVPVVPAAEHSHDREVQEVTLESFVEAEPDAPVPAEEVGKHTVPMSEEVGSEPIPEPEPVTEPSEEPVTDQEPEPEPESEPEPEPEPEVQRAPALDVDALYSTAFSLEEAGDHRGATRILDRILSADPDNTDALKLRAEIAVRTGDLDSAVTLAGKAAGLSPDDPDPYRIMGEAKMAKGDLGGALSDLDTAVSMGADDADVHVARGEVLERMGVLDRASECYSAAVSRDPSRLDLAERLARMMYARKEAIAADGMLNRILRRDPRRMSAILLKAEIANARKDDKSLMAAYDYFVKCPNPGPENTVRMVRILEESGHQAEAKGLVVGRPQKDVADNSVKRYAEKALRRAFSMKVSPTDPDLINALGLDQESAAEVTAYLAEQPDYGSINPGSESFGRMESLSRDAVMKLDWRDLEHNPRLPLERVFVQCGCKDADSAKEIVAYVLRAMLADPGRNADPRLSDMSMRLPKGITVYEIMRECGVGVYEARVVQSLIV